MLTKAQNKYIRSLTQQKSRHEYKVFTAEGEKIALEWLHAGGPVKMVIAAEEWAGRYKAVIAKHPEAEVFVVKEHELAALSSQQAPSGVMLVVPMTERTGVPTGKEWYIALDELQDPGNMGTIIRIADWFGIKHIVCSPGCVDVYNPKVVQSAMGGHLRVNIYEHDLPDFLSGVDVPKYAAMLDGQSIYTMERQSAGVLIIGNESRGISVKVAACASHKVTIPGKGGAESLNAGVSAGILCAMLLPC